MTSIFYKIYIKLRRGPDDVEGRTKEAGKEKKLLPEKPFTGHIGITYMVT